jgi:hypothetical protein
MSSTRPDPEVERIGRQIRKARDRRVTQAQVRDHLGMWLCDGEPVGLRQAATDVAELPGTRAPAPNRPASYRRELLAAIGFVLVGLRLRTGSIWVGILVHWVNNTTAVLALMVPCQGGGLELPEWGRTGRC